MSTKIEIDTDVFKTIKGIAKDKKTTEKKIINDILKKEIETVKNKIPDYLIANKDTYNPDNERMRKHAGFIKNVEPFDAVKIVREAREGRWMIFLDANYLVSYYIPSEDHHERALEIFEEIEHIERIISKAIIAETINILHNKIKTDFNEMERVYKELNNNYKVIEDHYLYDKTIIRVLKDKKRLPFFDNLYIVLMKELGIKKIATFDKHFNNIEGIERIY